jgi:hypothetical protein
MFQMPTSSVMMTRILGGFACAAWPRSEPATEMDMIKNAQSVGVSFVPLAFRFIRFLL